MYTDDESSTVSESSDDDTLQQDMELAYALLEEENARWNTLLFDEYEVIVSDLDRGTPTEFIYEDVSEATAIYNKYIETKKNGKIERELNELGDIFVLNKRFTSYEYLITRLNGSITSNEGITFVEAVALWGMRALELPDQKKLIGYLANSNNCTRLLSYIVRENDWEMFSYVLHHDTRESKNTIVSYIEALYISLITCQAQKGSGQILAILTGSESPIKFKGKTMKNLVLRSIEDKSLEEVISTTCYSMIMSQLYWTNKDHRFFFLTVDKFEEIVERGTERRSKIQTKSMTNLFETIVFILLNRNTELVLSYIKKAARYPMFNKVVVAAIKREIGEDSEIEERTLYLESLESIAFDNMERNPELTTGVVAMLNSFKNKDYNRIAASIYLANEARR